MDQVLISEVITWLNSNQGVVSVALFLATILFGWATGIFATLRRKPKLEIKKNEGPTFVCTYGIGQEHEGYDAHRTGIALYLRVINIGSAPTNIEEISIGYRWAIIPFTKLWWKYGLFRFWIEDQTIALDDFQAALPDDRTLVYPFLVQSSSISGKSAETFLDVGKSTNGVVYFEQSDSFGGCFPKSKDYQVSLRVTVKDVYGKKHSKKIVVPKVDLAGARRFNPSFGLTRTMWQEGQEIFDLPTDEDGNLLPPAQQS